MKIILIFLFANLINFDIKSEEFSNATAYYIPFQIETYDAITPENIKQRARYKIVINKKTDLSQLHDLVTKGELSKSFETSRVRLLVVFDSKKKILIDSYGNTYNEKTKLLIDPDHFKDLERLLDRLLKSQEKP